MSGVAPLDNPWQLFQLLAEGKSGRGTYDDRLALAVFSEEQERGSESSVKETTHNI